VRASKYLARDLVVDLDPNSKRHLKLLRAACASTQELLRTMPGEEGQPLFTFASMILAQIARDWNGAEELAGPLIQDKSGVRENHDLAFLITDDRFHLGLTNYDQLHHEWLAFARGLRNPKGHEQTQLVIDALAR